MKLKCLNCRFFDPNRMIFGHKKGYCRLLGKPLENAQAMRNLSKLCDVDNVHKRDYHKRLNKLVRKALVSSNKKIKNILVLGCHPDNDVENLLEKRLSKKTNMSFIIIEPDARFGKFYAKIPRTKIIREVWEKLTINKAFDCILCLDCIEHSKEPYKILNKITKLSNFILLSCPNGLYFFQDPHRHQDHGHGPHISHFTRSELKDFFKSKGFRVKMTGIDKSWLGPFSFGIFLITSR